MPKIERNVNHVPRRMWERWSNQARAVFNTVYAFATENQWAMLHPQQRPPKSEYWATTCWNMAWIAADAVDGIVPSSILEDSASA